MTLDEINKTEHGTLSKKELLEKLNIQLNQTAKDFAEVMPQCQTYLNRLVEIAAHAERLEGAIVSISEGKAEHLFKPGE